MNKRWTTKWQLMQLLDLTEAEFKDFVKNQGLPAYTSEGYPIDVPDYKEIASRYKNSIELSTKVASNAKRDFEHKLKLSIFNIDELRTFLKENELLHLVPQERKPQGGESQEDHPFLVSDDSSLKWQDITISFLSDWEIHIQFFDKGVTRRYDQIGFDDGRSGKPVSAWHVFQIASEHKEIPYNFDNRGKVEKHAGEIRKKINRLFPNIPGDPVPINKKEKVYKFAFQLKPPVD